ncbi:nuclear transport factor 2 family protein [Novosphingobium beihaiensis]|uniref:Nuclear transport factor 2 family protein n=1 Tax=Novosphingobium beihaiensis TaxID=2930389 RepID=A0ABT0BS80_9SPHN|nr:nuclear transport factor 2 family protein [Novosphingobium beihaiensis]MCJ2187925.1 nuclear transport factor 2 family protein [Novosphingobium beihaiensis]
MGILQTVSRFLPAGLLALAPAVDASPEAPAGATQAGVLAVEAVRLKAMLEGDVETLRRMTGDDYVHVESTGQVRTKEEFLAGFKDREYRFVSFVIEENHVNLMGNVAVVTGRYRNVIETPAGVQPVKYARHVRVYAFRGGEWINVTHQATAISPTLL